MITIVDYGTSNLGSMQNMLKKIGASSRSASTSGELRDADKIILPGVGSFDAGMKRLNESGMVPILTEKALVQKVPVLGVCLGMQLMTRGSEEGTLNGLGWLNAVAKRFDQRDDPDLKVPHMGWNEVFVRKDDVFASALPTSARFYFAHSYHVVCDSQDDVLLEARYGKAAITASIAAGNVIAAQFHPEKSHKFGMWFLKRFVERR